MAKVGDRIRIWYMEGEPSYAGKEGTVTRIDDIGQMFGTWGGCAVIPGTDEYEVVNEKQGSNKESAEEVR